MQQVQRRDSGCEGIRRMNIILKEARDRKEVLLKELKVLDSFISFYEGQKSEPCPISSSLTIRQLSARKNISVRLANCLLNYFDKKPDGLTIGDVKAEFEIPLLPEVEKKLMQMPQFGRKALNELKDILENVINQSSQTKGSV